MALKQIKTFYTGGNTRELFHILNNSLNGEYQSFFSSGIKWEDAYYINGQKHGEYRLYYKDGTLMKKMFYINGEDQNIDIDKLTKDDKMYLSLKHGVTWL